MFEFAGNGECQSKCYVSYGTMGHLDPAQPPVKRKPYASILALPFVHKVELTLPKELYGLVQDQISQRVPLYHRVILPLNALVEGEFFNEYIKKGNILMLSEGQHGIDNVYSLQNGILTLALDKESYERTGLVGKPDGSKGKRGSRARWIVEINLRQPSMLHGRKAFDRIVYAFKNALKNPVTWLFTDLSSQGNHLSDSWFSGSFENILLISHNSESLPNPIQKHFPVVVNCKPQTSSELRVTLPSFEPPMAPKTPDGDDFTDYAADLYEWLSLITLGSRRVTTGDQINPFLSRYAPPVAESAVSDEIDLVKVTWQGFLSARWAHQIFVQVMIAVGYEAWFAVAISGFGQSLPSECRDVMILKLPGLENEYLSWEVDQK